MRFGVFGAALVAAAAFSMPAFADFMSECNDVATSNADPNDDGICACLQENAGGDAALEAELLELGAKDADDRMASASDAAKGVIGACKP